MKILKPLTFMIKMQLEISLDLIFFFKILTTVSLQLQMTKISFRYL